MLLSCQPHENIKAGQNSEKLLFKSCMMDQKEQFYELLEKHISCLAKKKDKFIITKRSTRRSWNVCNSRKGVLVLEVLTSNSGATKTPYEVVFGQRPRKDFLVLQELANQGQLHEDEIGPEMFEDEVAHESQVNDKEEEPSQVEDEDGQPEPDIPTAPHPCTPQRLGKRGRTFELLQDHQVVATGVQHPNRLQLHGQEIGQNTHTVIEITSVIGSDLTTG